MSGELREGSNFKDKFGCKILGFLGQIGLYEVVSKIKVGPTRKTPGLFMKKVCTQNSQIPS